jgi:Mn2+/Fe2+ NRAMP family transporter
MNLRLDRIGTIGVFLTAILSPCCFPLFSFALSAMGLGSVTLFGGWTMYVFQGLVFLSLIGFYLSYRKHKNILPFLIGIIAFGLIIYSYYLNKSDNLICILYAVMFALLVATGLNYYIAREQKKACSTCSMSDGKSVELQSVILCPHCGHKKNETMPTDSCLFFYQCEHCKMMLKPKAGDCCIYCSYGTVKCPSKQKE